MDDIWFLLATVDLILVIVFSGVVISRRREPAVTLSWILTFLILNYFGFFLYLFFGYKKLRRKRKRKPNPSRRAFFEVTDHALVPNFAKVAKMAKELTDFPVTSGNQVILYEEAFATYGAIAEAIKSAKHHVHMEYYIFQPDETGLYFRDLLIQRAREGIECRLLLDAIGSIRVGRRFIRPMLEAGVRVEFFGPVRTVRRLSYDLRNHRKLIVVDGRLGFIGSQNIGNEYLQWRNRLLSWRDSHVKLEGPVVNQLQVIFAEDWHFTTDEDLSGPLYFPKQDKKGSSLVQTLPTGPDEEEHTLQLIFLAAIHEARKRVTITTPYFVPNSNMMLALEGAARRGVVVDLLFPKKSDQALLDLARRSWYRELLDCGVRLFEYAESFVHAKVVTIDHRLALVGSANMDIRSFLVNFESSILIYDEEVTSQLQVTFDKILTQAKRMTPEDVGQGSLLKSFVDGMCRVISPLL